MKCIIAYSRYFMVKSELVKEKYTMKEYQNLIGKIIVAAAIITGSVIIGNAILEASGNIGSQIASALNTIASQIQ